MEAKRGPASASPPHHAALASSLKRSRASSSSSCDTTPAAASSPSCLWMGRAMAVESNQDEARASWVGPCLYRSAERLFYGRVRLRGREYQIGDRVEVATRDADLVIAGRNRVGTISSLYQALDGTARMAVFWFYHPEETARGRRTVDHPRELFCSTVSEDGQAIDDIISRCTIVHKSVWVNSFAYCDEAVCTYFRLYYVGDMYDPATTSWSPLSDLPAVTMNGPYAYTYDPQVCEMYWRQEILAFRRGRNGKPQYLVTWKGELPESPMWEFAKEVPSQLIVMYDLMWRRGHAAPATPMIR